LYNSKTIGGGNLRKTGYERERAALAEAQCVACQTEITVRLCSSKKIEGGKLCKTLYEREHAADDQQINLDSVNACFYLRYFPYCYRFSNREHYKAAIRLFDNFDVVIVNPLRVQQIAHESKNDNSMGSTADESCIY